jgi:PKD repeat protein
MKMNYKLPLLLSAAAAIALASCNSGGDPAPSEEMPVACATLSSDSVTINEVITFKNCSQKAYSYSWDFGDGSAASSAKEPTHKYTAKGTYNVKVKAFSLSGSLSKEATYTVFVGDRYIRGFQIKQMPFKKPNGDNWDADGSGPDVFLSFYPESDHSKIKGSTPRDNATQATLPINFTGYDEMATNETWTIVIADSDDPTPEVMTTLAFNPAVDPVTIVSTGWEVDVLYTLKP